LFTRNSFHDKHELAGYILYLNFQIKKTGLTTA
jgi:hypothetical protein